jgi:hypothetical protein
LGSADLVTFNGPQSQIDALDVGIHKLAALNPAIVLAQASAFGGPTAHRLKNMHIMERSM